MGVVPSSSCEWVGSGWNVRSVCMWCVGGGGLKRNYDGKSIFNMCTYT